MTHVSRLAGPIAKGNFRNETDYRMSNGSPHPALSPHRMRGEGGFSRVRGVPAHDVALAEFPRRAIIARKPLAGFRVVEDALSLRVPLDLPAREHGDEAEVSGKSGVMGHLHRGDRGLPRFHAVEKVAPVAALGERQFHLALVLREAAGVFPFLVRGFEGIAAVHPDPALGADPLGAVPDVRVPAGDD